MKPVIQTPSGKRKKNSSSGSSPGSAGKANKKSDNKQSPPKVIATVEPLATMDAKHDELKKLIENQCSILAKLNDTVSTVSRDLTRIDADNKSLIADNTLAIRNLEAAHNSKATRDDARLNAMEERVNNITDLIASGTALSMDADLTPEKAHERYLQKLIEDSKKCVTVLGHGETDLNCDNLAIRMAEHNYMLGGSASSKVIQLSQLGTSENPPYKLVLDSPSTAQMLIEQSKTKSRAAAGTGTHMRFVRHFPQLYANAARDFRQMAALLYDKGAYASVEYEGTTLTLRGKSKEPGGEWVIVPGGEFRPLVVGRQVGPEGEPPALAKARLLLGSVLNNEKDSSLARSLNLHSETTLTDVDAAKTYLGPLISAGLTEVKPAESRKGSNVKYSIIYETRDHALKALANSKIKGTITNLKEDDGFLTIALPVVAP